MLQNFFTCKNLYFVNDEVRTGCPKLGHTNLYHVVDYLDVEDRVGVDVYAGGLYEDTRQPVLVVLLHLHHLPTIQRDSLVSE